MGTKEAIGHMREAIRLVAGDAEAIANDEAMPDKVRSVASLLFNCKGLIENAIEFVPVTNALAPVLEMMTGDNAAQNYVTVDVEGADGRAIVITAQYVDGKTPAQELQRLERELGLKRREMEQAYVNLTSVQRRCSELLEDNRRLRAILAEGSECVGSS